MPGPLRVPLATASTVVWPNNGGLRKVFGHTHTTANVLTNVQVLRSSSLSRCFVLEKKRFVYLPAHLPAQSANPWLLTSQARNNSLAVVVNVFVYFSVVRPDAASLLVCRQDASCSDGKPAEGHNDSCGTRMVNMMTSRDDPKSSLSDFMSTIAVRSAGSQLTIWALMQIDNHRKTTNDCGIVKFMKAERRWRVKTKQASQEWDNTIKRWKGEEKGMRAATWTNLLLVEKMPPCRQQFSLEFWSAKVRILNPFNPAF